MNYSESEARKIILEAGLKLVKEKLVARTWGNISARVSDTSFLITPSGIAYEDIREEDLVLINIEDCSWSGDVKPSSEKGIHAVVYALHPEVGFVIHTHQLYASAIGVTGCDSPFAPCAAYGLPGTEELKKNVRKSIEENPDSRVFLMARHGALCFAEDCEAAFKEASLLEKNSMEYFVKQTAHINPKRTCRAYLDDYAQIFGNGHCKPVNSDEFTIKSITEKNRAAALFAGYKKGMNIFDVMLQHLVFKHKYSKLKDSRRS